MMREKAIQYFRRLALLLHPDKNLHPLAKEAFQKLSEA
jgi:curved DNA-binding protein CbpA